MAYVNLTDRVTGGTVAAADINTLMENINLVLPVGGIIPFHKTLPSAPALADIFVECDGAAISDADSLFNGYRSPNLNGADVVLTLTWTADAGGAYTTVAATDLTALAVGDDVTGSGIAADSYISDITGTTVTITDVSATGSISSTFTNDGRFLRGGATSGTGQRTQIKGHRHEAKGDTGSVTNTNVNDVAYAGLSNLAGPYTVNGMVLDAYTDGTNGEVLTGKENYPTNTNIVYIMRIK